MTNTKNSPTERTYDRLMEKALEMGMEHGGSAGSWVSVDGSNAQLLLTGCDDGDPEILDMCPAPLSGEFADGYTPTLLREELELSEADWELNELGTALQDNYELGFSQGYWDDVQRRARYQLAD